MDRERPVCPRVSSDTQKWCKYPHQSRRNPQRAGPYEPFRLCFSRYTSGFRGIDMKKYGKFAALVVVVLGAMVWLAFSGSNDSKSYYKTISELGKMGDQAQTKRVRVAGDVEDGSIQHVNSAVQFTLKQDAL